MQIDISRGLSTIVFAAAGVTGLTQGGVFAATIPETNLQPSVWLDAGSISGLNSGASVGSWADSSGNNRNAVNTNTARQPTYQAGQANGRPVVRFNVNAGTPDEFLAFPGALANTPASNLTLFVVANDTGQRSNTNANARGIVVNTRTNGTTANGFLLGYNGQASAVPAGPVAGVYAHVNHSSIAGPLQLNTFGEDDFNLFALRRSANVSEVSTYDDLGGSTTTTTWNTTDVNGNPGFTPSTLTTTQVGTEGGGNYFFGDIAEIIAFEGAALTASETDAVNRYLGQKYDIAAVPEPAAATALVGVAGLLMRRCRVR